MSGNTFLTVGVSSSTTETSAHHFNTLQQCRGISALSDGGICHPL
ncbi:MAG: hypothetical protein ABF491_04290 [Acetobacter sp.]